MNNKKPEGIRHYEEIRDYFTLRNKEVNVEIVKEADEE